MDNNNKKKVRKTATLAAALGIVAMTYSCGTFNKSDEGRGVYGPPPSQYKQNDSTDKPLILDSDTIAAPDTIKNQEKDGNSSTSSAQENKGRGLRPYKDRMSQRPKLVYGPPPKDHKKDRPKPKPKPAKNK